MNVDSDGGGSDDGDGVAQQLTRQMTLCMCLVSLLLFLTVHRQRRDQSRLRLCL